MQVWEQHEFAVECKTCKICYCLVYLASGTKDLYVWYGQRIKDLKKVIEHLTFIRNNIYRTRTSKNTLRVIVRNDPIRSKNPSEVLFLEAKIQPMSKLLVTSEKKKISVTPRQRKQTEKDQTERLCIRRHGN